jgi:23S rRNA (adenine2503-C2)-methyltransferase
LPANALTSPVAGKPSKLSLLGLPAAQLVEFFENIGEKPYRARQIMRWAYQRYVTEYAEMTDLSAALRKQLAEITTLALPAVLKHEHSDDGTRKAARRRGNPAVEAVYHPEPDRGTLCIRRKPAARSIARSVPRATRASTAI